MRGIEIETTTTTKTKNQKPKTKKNKKNKQFRIRLFMRGKWKILGMPLHHYFARRIYAQKSEMKSATALNAKTSFPSAT